MARRISFLRYLIGLFIVLLVLPACKKNDDEPILPATRISRLYVSFSDIQLDDLAEPYNNIGVFDPADSANFPTMDAFNSKALEGAGIFYNPYARRVFQSSIQDFSVKTFSVSQTGVLGPASSFIDSTLVSQFDLAYDHKSLNLYVSNNLTNSIHVYDKASSRNGVLPFGPNKRFVLEGQPRGLVLDNDSLLLVLRTGVQNSIALLEKPSAIDSGVVQPSALLLFPNAEDLRGLAYSSKLDLLVTTDVKTGRVYFIPNAKTAFMNRETLAAPQFLGGINSEFIEPIDVAIDDRDDKAFLYVADRKLKESFAFPLRIAETWLRMQNIRQC